jgi:hypothetical protein
MVDRLLNFRFLQGFRRRQTEDSPRPDALAEVLSALNQRNLMQEQKINRLLDETKGFLVERLAEERAFREEFSHGIKKEIVGLIDARLKEERIFREEFSHGIKRELLVDLTRVVELSGTGDRETNEKAIPLISEQLSYEHDFAFVSKSFRRDLLRSLNSYISFEKYFLGSENTPYYIIVPDADLESFHAVFQTACRQGDINHIPLIVNEETILERTGQPYSACQAMEGYYLQQVIKLSFGLTGIARNYMLIDADCYFIHPFDRNHLLAPDRPACFIHEAWHGGFSRQELERNREMGHGDARLAGFDYRFIDAAVLIKTVLGATSAIYRNYVVSANIIDSNIIRALNTHLKTRGIANFVYAIQVAPFEFQWYGEYLYMTQDVATRPYPFFSVDPSEIGVVLQRNQFSPFGKFGIQYQSVDYSSGTSEEHSRIAPDIRFLDEADRT